MYDLQVIAKRIKDTAKQKKYQIKDLLSDCDLGVNALSELSKGKNMSFVSFALIADALDVSVDYLLGNTDIKEKSSPVKPEELSDIDNLILEKFKTLPQERKKEFLDYLNYLLTKPQDN